MPPYPAGHAALAMLHWQCCASLSVLCVCSNTQQPTKPITFQIKAGCHALYICGDAYAVPCKEYFMNIIFLVDMLLANGYVGIITSNKGSEQ